MLTDRKVVANRNRDLVPAPRNHGKVATKSLTDSRARQNDPVQSNQDGTALVRHTNAIETEIAKSVPRPDLLRQVFCKFWYFKGEFPRLILFPLQWWKLFQTVK